MQQRGSRGTGHLGRPESRGSQWWGKLIPIEASAQSHRVTRVCEDDGGQRASEAPGGLRGLRSAWGGTWGREGLGFFSSTEASCNGDAPQRLSAVGGAVR